MYDHVSSLSCIQTRLMLLLARLLMIYFMIYAWYRLQETKSHRIPTWYWIGKKVDGVKPLHTSPRLGTHSDTKLHLAHVRFSSGEDESRWSRPDRPFWHLHYGMAPAITTYLPSSPLTNASVTTLRLHLVRAPSFVKLEKHVSRIHKTHTVSWINAIW